MTHRGWLLSVVLLLISAAFAGCLGGDDDPEPSDSNDDTDGNDGGGGNNTTDDEDDIDIGDTDTGDAETASPVAALAVNETAATDEELVFDAGATTDADTPIENLTFTWDFGDGETAEGVNATHAFVDEGNFTVNLTVTDPEGNTGTANTTIVVTGGFSDTELPALEGTLALANPLVHTLSPAYTPASGACGTNLECYVTFGGAEGDLFALHEIDVPAGAAAVTIDSPDNSESSTLQFAVFDADGVRIHGATIGTGAAPQSTTILAERAGGGLTVFVSTPLSPGVSYTITVTALAEPPE